MKRIWAAQVVSRRAADNPKRLQTYETVSVYRSLKEKNHDIVTLSCGTEFALIIGVVDTRGLKNVTEGFSNEKKYV
jgi:hypothetical protein